MADIWSLEALCRCCHADGVFKSLQQQHEVDSTVENYLCMLGDTLGVKIKPPPGNASYSICDVCIAQLRSATKFKKQVLECEAKFEEYCKNELLANYDIKTEPEYLDDNIFSNAAAPLVFVDDRLPPGDPLACLPASCMINNSDDDKDTKPDKPKEFVVKNQRPLKTIKKEDDKGTIEISVDVKPNVDGKPNRKKNKSIKGKPKTKPKEEESLVVKVKTETGELFSCKNCGVSYEDLDELNRHINEEHSKGFKCCYCQETFTRELRYKIHCRQEHGETKPFQCQFCGKKMGGRLTLTEHINCVHTKEKYFQCDICQKRFHSKPVLRIHLRKHDGTFRKLICEQCGVGCNDRTNLRLHVMTVHEKLRLFNCNECDKSFSAAKHLKIHLRKHTGERPFECDVCQRAFTSKDSLTVHQKIHSNSGYKCKTCSKVFLTRSQYASHYRSHVGAKPFKCHLCHKEFAGKYSLNRHVFEHTGERPFVCPICNKDFKQKPQLVRHNFRFHNPNKPEVVKERCDICKRRVPNIDKHMEAHTNKPYGCHLCEKKYPEQNALNRHLQRHTGIKPHQCDLCDKGFIQLKSLKNHKLRIHKLPLKTEHEDHYDSLVTTYTFQNLKRAYRTKF